MAAYNKIFSIKKETNTVIAHNTQIYVESFAQVHIC